MLWGRLPKLQTRIPRHVRFYGECNWHRLGWAGVSCQGGGISEAPGIDDGC